MKPSEIPSGYRAFAIRFATDAGIDPDHLEAVICGLAEDVPLAQRIVTALFPLVEPGDFLGLGLTARTEDSTLKRTMRTENSTPSVRKGRPLRKNGYNKAGAQVVAHLRATGGTFAEDAKKLGCSPRTVAFYCLAVDEPNYRALPTRAAEFWLKTRHVPLKDWPRISD